MTLEDAAARLSQPDVTPQELADIAARHPELHVRIAAHPLAYPELLTWLAQLHDRDIDAALTHRTAAPTKSHQPTQTSTPPRSASPRRKAFVVLATVTVVALIGGAVAVAMTKAGRESHDPAPQSKNLAGEQGSETAHQSGSGLLALGEVTTVDPSRVSIELDDAKIQQVALGTANEVAVALDTDGRLLVWGDRFDPETATNQPELLMINSPVLSDQRFTKVAAGSNHTLALTTDGKVLVWGSGMDGNLGDSKDYDLTTGTSKDEPVQVGETTGFASHEVVDIAAGDGHSLALTKDGAVYAWGDGSSNQLADGRHYGDGGPGLWGSSTPQVTQLSGLLSGNKIVSIYAGGNQSGALADDGSLYVWGSTPDVGGDLGQNVSANPPRELDTSQVSAGTQIVRVSLGHDHGLALADDGTVYAWGANDDGQLGIGSQDGSSSLTPVDVSGLGSDTQFVAVAAGQEFSLAISEDREVYGWGLGDSGQLGEGNFGGSSTPVAVEIPTGSIPIDIFAGYNQSVLVVD